MANKNVIRGWQLEHQLKAELGLEPGWPARMWPCGRVRQQGAGPRRKVSFSGRLEAFPLSLPCEGLLWAGPSRVCTWTQQPLRPALPGCGFPLSGRNTGSVSRGRGLWFPVAEPGPGREATNEVWVCVCLRGGPAPSSR